jgi:MFS family permease
MRILVDFSLFRRNPNFTLLYIGQFASFMGTMITSVALPFQIYTITHSTLMVGLLSLVQLLPLIFTALLGGVFADRYHRRILLMVTESILMLGSLALAWNAHLAQPSIVAIFLLAAFMSAFTGLHRPALDSIVQQIVAKRDLPTVSAVGMFKTSFTMIAGPAIGGLIISQYGIVAAYFADMSTFLVSLCALLLMRHIPKPQNVVDEPVMRSLVTGFKYAFSRQELVGSYLVDFIAMIFGMPNALFPAIAQTFGGAQVLGLLYSAPAAGALLVSFFSGSAHIVKRHGRAIAISAMLWGVAIIGFGLSANFYWALFFLGLAGCFDAISGIYRGIMWNETIPNHLRGRLSGIEMISYLAGPRLGDTEAGLVAAAFGVTASIVSGGVLCVAGVAVCCYFLPKYWRYHSETSIELKL